MIARMILQISEAVKGMLAVWWGLKSNFGVCLELFEKL